MHEVENFRRNVVKTIDVKKLKKLRIAAALKTSRSWLDRVLKGEIDPTFSRAVDIAKVISVPLRELILPPEIYDEHLAAPAIAK